jgi:hypothetical protein
VSEKLLKIPVERLRRIALLFSGRNRLARDVPSLLSTPKAGPER